MAYLPLANILHHKLRSVLSAFGIGVGICMLITLTGLSKGSLGEIADRWEAVNADLIVFPKNWANNISNLSGAYVPDDLADEFRKRTDLVQDVVPVLMYRVNIGGQDNMAAGIDPRDWDRLTGGKQLVEGRLFDPQNKCADWLVKTVLGDSADDKSKVLDVQDEDLAKRGGMELVVDERLAKSAHFRVGQEIEMESHKWTIVGIAPSGVMTRVFMPRRTAQRFFGGLLLKQSTLQFIKLKPGRDANAAVLSLRGPHADLMPVRQYRAKLEQTWGMMFVYIEMVNGFALAIAFLFILITLYMMVIQRTRDIAILKSCGASNGFIRRQMLAESMLLTFGGTAMGIALSFPAAWLITTVKPLLTVQLSWHWIVIAIGAALVGAVLSALYPAWRATRVDMVEALTLE